MGMIVQHFAETNKAVYTELLPKPTILTTQMRWLRKTSWTSLATAYPRVISILSQPQNPFIREMAIAHWYLTYSMYLLGVQERLSKTHIPCLIGSQEISHLIYEGCSLVVCYTLVFTLVEWRPISHSTHLFFPLYSHSDKLPFQEQI